MQRIALTTGEPAGIGPDLTVMLAQQDLPFSLIAIGDKDMLAERADALALPLTIHEAELLSSAKPTSAGELLVCHVPVAEAVTAGRLNPANAGYVLSTLDVAVNGCETQQFDAMVTAPVHKGVINDAGINFTGHTEYLAEKSASDPVMMLATENLRVALATTHLPLSAVPKAITRQTLRRVLTVLHAELQTRFTLINPHILVCGLNPHAGEQGHLGREEIDIIAPVLSTLRDEGLNLTGPLPADTLFTPHHLSDADAVLAMYHDQGLPVLKYAGFGNAVNITLGLPFIRTSVDHGTAIDKAGSNDIDIGSLHAAIKSAKQMASAQNGTH